MPGVRIPHRGVPACEGARADSPPPLVTPVHTHVTFKVALPTQELRDIRNAEKTREIIFFWLPAALLSTFTFYYEATTPWSALDALLFGLR